MAMIHVEFIEDLRVGDIVIYDSNENHYGYVKDIYEHYDNNDEVYYTAKIVWFDEHHDTIWDSHDLNDDPVRVIRND